MNEQWKFGQILRHGPFDDSLTAMVVSDDGRDARMITLGGSAAGTYATYYQVGQVWTWQVGREEWIVVDEPPQAP